VSLSSEISLRIAARTGVCVLEIAVLFLPRSKRMIESDLGDGESGRERSSKSAP